MPNHDELNADAGSRVNQRILDRLERSGALDALAAGDDSMQRMARRRGKYRPKSQLDKDGVPLKASQWTKDDWSDLHKGIKGIKAKIARRHAPSAPDERSGGQ